MENNELPKFVTLQDLAKFRCFMVDRDGNVDNDYNEGANFILDNLEKDLDKGIEINKDWVDRPVPIRKQGSILSMHDYLDGAVDILNRIGVLVYNGRKLDMNTWIFAHMEKFLLRK